METGAVPLNHVHRLQQIVRQRTVVMGILNVTPDSFYDGGRYTQAEVAVQRALQMVQDGADIVDIGGESTRPGSQPVPEEEELRRVLPVIQAVRERADVPISIDTTKSCVAERALQAGACMVNDISGLGFDPHMAEVVARHGALCCIMHIQGTPQTMQQNPQYEDVVRDISRYFEERLALAERTGIPRENIWLDPRHRLWQNSATQPRNPAPPARVHRVWLAHPHRHLTQVVHRQDSGRLAPRRATRGHGGNGCHRHYERRERCARA